MGFIAHATELLLSWLVTPPLVTSLEASGATIDIRGIFLGPGQWMGRWDASSLGIFLVGALGLAVAVPVRSLAERVTLVSATLFVCLVVTVGVSAVEVCTAAVNWAAGRDDIFLVDEAERGFLQEAHGSLGLLQMLLPALIAVVGYGLHWSREDEDSDGGWRLAVLLGVAVLALMIGLQTPPRLADRAGRLQRLARTADLNPRSAKVWLAYAEAAVGVGSPDALAAFERAAANGADSHAVRIGTSRAWLAKGEPARALASAERALAQGPASPALLVVEARALARLGRACDAEARLARAIAARQGTVPRVLVSARARAARKCRESM